MPARCAHTCCACLEEPERVACAAQARLEEVGVPDERVALPGVAISGRIQLGVAKRKGPPSGVPAGRPGKAREAGTEVGHLGRGTIAATAGAAVPFDAGSFVRSRCTELPLLPAAWPLPLLPLLCWLLRAHVPIACCTEQLPSPCQAAEAGVQQVQQNNVLQLKKI